MQHNIVYCKETASVIIITIVKIEILGNLLVLYVDQSRGFCGFGLLFTIVRTQIMCRRYNFALFKSCALHQASIALRNAELSDVGPKVVYGMTVTFGPDVSASKCPDTPIV
jgi:hypothetical protein